MMHILTAEEMREMDRQTIETFGLPGRLLMENAGRGATRVLLDTWPDIYAKSVAVVAGKGNNGGDGFVIARYLAQYGVNVAVYLLAERDKVKGDAGANFKLLETLGIPVVEMPDELTFSQHKAEIAHKHLIVDAILGTGLTSDVKGYFREVIDFMNRLGRPIFSVDIPSGLHTETGRPCGICIHADATATFAFTKLGHLMQPGAGYTGKLSVIDIGIPPHIVQYVAPRQQLLSADWARSRIHPRHPETHKGQTGHVMVVAGGTGKTGAAAMTAMAAMRAGAGLVTLGVPESLNATVEPQVTEVMTEPLPESENGTFAAEGADRILSLLSGKKALALGPGMGASEEVRHLVHRLVAESPVPVVLDADGVNSLEGEPAVLKKHRADIVLTPHPGEMARLTGKSTADIQGDRVAAAREVSRIYGVYTVLKGARSLIADPDGHVHVNPTGNAGMASGGMGDVLTGMIAAFIAQGYPAGEAACLAVYLHGAAADILAESRGPFGYLATDVMNHLPDTIARILSGAFKDVTSGYYHLL